MSRSLSRVRGPLPTEASAEPVERRWLRVEHHTELAYSSPVEEAHHVACLRPVSDEFQTLHAYQLRCDPQPLSLSQRLDTFGNLRQFFGSLPPHRILSLQATSWVELHPPRALTPGPSLPWEQVRERLSYRSGAPFEPAVEFVQASPRVPLLPELRTWALQEFSAGRSLSQAALALMARLHTEFTFDPQATEVHTPLAEAFAQRRGVCQDFSHILLGALRALGLAARYVSGYLLTDAPPGQARLQGADASHAWVALWCPHTQEQDQDQDKKGGEGHWLPLDPTNNCVPGNRHVRLAHGRDYDDVSPLRGVIRGGGSHEVMVSVTTSEVDAEELLRAQTAQSAGTDFASQT
jgi:transglutaminase-like putative cysteine protease